MSGTQKDGPAKRLTALEIATAITAHHSGETPLNPEVLACFEMVRPLDRDHFTCRFFDAVNGQCTIYEKRPNMCRDYGVTVPCMHEGCEWSGAKR